MDLEKQATPANLLLAAAALLVVGAFLPWVSAFGLSANAFDADLGFLIVVGAGFMGYVGWQRKQGNAIQKNVEIGLYVSAGVIVLVTLINFFDSAFQIASRGIGLWLTAAGAVVAVLGVLAYRKNVPGGPAV